MTQFSRGPEPPKPGKMPLSAPRSRRHCLGPKKNERTQQLEPASLAAGLKV